MSSGGASPRHEGQDWRKAPGREGGFEISCPELLGGIAEPRDEFGVETPEKPAPLGGGCVEERCRTLLQLFGVPQNGFDLNRCQAIPEEQLSSIGCGEI